MCSVRSSAVCNTLTSVVWRRCPRDSDKERRNTKQLGYKPVANSAPRYARSSRIQLRDSASSGYRKAEKRVENNTHSGVFFDEMRRDWTADETQSGVFDISSKSKQKLRGKRGSKIVKIYAN